MFDREGVCLEECQGAYTHTHKHVHVHVSFMRLLKDKGNHRNINEGCEVLLTKGKSQLEVLPGHPAELVPQVSERCLFVGNCHCLDTQKYRTFFLLKLLTDYYE